MLRRDAVAGFVTTYGTVSNGSEGGVLRPRASFICANKLECPRSHRTARLAWEGIRLPDGSGEIVPVSRGIPGISWPVMSPE